MSSARIMIGVGALVLIAAGVVAVRSGSGDGPQPLPAASTRAPQAKSSAGRLGIGRQPLADEIARRDITVFPTGAGLPKGRGSAVAGEPIYRAQCASCHGDRGEGRDPLAPALAGGVGSLASAKPQATVGSYWPYATSVFDYTRRAMPYQTPGSLTSDEVYAVTAYMLFLNGIVERDQVLDETSLPAVKMPNLDGFVRDPRPDIHASVAPAR